ncbi:MAG TPA: enoyl-CoA hydratase/isomerase family protein [Acidimicrobiia bacterium]|nr:enoyl-CoA hydratase/isomerase family protein [Acidimicrobiia bacterium]
MGFVRRERRDGFEIVTLDRPDRLNALGPEVIGELIETFIAVEADAAPVVVLGAAGKHFCAGGDFAVMGESSALGAYRDMEPFHRLARCLATRRALLIAAVQGAAVGAGLGLVLAADMIVAAPDARFGAAFAQAGLVPDTGVLYSLPRRVGVSRAKELVLTGRKLGAEEAQAWGLVTRIAAEGDALAGALALAAEIAAASPPHAIELGRRLLDQSTEATFDQALVLEQLAQTLCRQTDDYTEAVAALQQRRPAKFTGR